MPTPSAQLALPAIAGSDSPDVPRDLNAVITALEANVKYIATKDILSGGQVGQIQLGRPLLLADFTTQGYTAPVGLYGLADLTDSSGNAASLSNKGTVTFGTGLFGAATEAAIFVGSTAQVLYRADTGAADPFRLRTGSWGGFFKCTKRGVLQYILSRRKVAGNLLAFDLSVNASNNLAASISTDGSTTAATASSYSDVADERWHHALATFDGSLLRLYVDGVLEAFVAATGAIFSSSAPLNIGGSEGDGSTVAASPFFGRVDWAILSSDVFSDDFIRFLVSSKIAHSLAFTPSSVRAQVRRRRRGSPSLTAFPSAPIRYHSFTAGAVTDAGSGAISLTPNPGTGSITSVAGADGKSGGAYQYAGAHTGHSSTDTGLPATTASRSYGAWVKSNTAAAGVLSWGTMTTAHAFLGITGGGAAQSLSGADLITGPWMIDGFWHHLVAVEDNTAADGLKRKLYFDGRLVAASTTLTSLTLAGANRFRVGAGSDGTLPLVGAVDEAFAIGVALTPEQVRAIYNAGSMPLPPSPRSEGEHVEGIDSTSIYLYLAQLESCDQIDLQVGR